MTLLDTIRDTADALTEPHQHTERIQYWDAHRNRKWLTHTTTQPGMVTQLYQAILPTNTITDSGATGVPASRPPLVLEATSRHLTIRAAVHRWCYSLNIKVRKSVESNIRALVGAAGSMDDDTARALLTEMRQWLRWCTVLTGWERVFQPAAVPCLVDGCGQTNTLRINLTNHTAMCRHCGATWAADDGSITVLAEYIRTHTDNAA